MKKLAASLLAASIICGGFAAHAGGPVVVAEEPEVVVDTPRSVWIVPVVIGAIVLCAIACGNDDEEPVVRN